MTLHKEEDDEKIDPMGQTAMQFLAYLIFILALGAILHKLIF